MTTTYAVGDSDERPWGRWEVLAIGEGHVVKRITVNPGGKLSLQYHHHRAEHWVIVAGEGLVTRGPDQLSVPAGEHVHIEQGTPHRIENPGSIPVVFVEVQQGDRLDEDDIVRLEDVYGRS